MMILCYSNIPSSLNVNKLGKWLYKHIDSAYKAESSSNMFDIYFTLVYQLKPEYQTLQEIKIATDTYEMNINVNITTYKNKIRVNITESDANSRTLNFYVSDPGQETDTIQFYQYILDKIYYTIRKYYYKYDFLM